MTLEPGGACFTLGPSQLYSQCWSAYLSVDVLVNKGYYVVLAKCASSQMCQVGQPLSACGPRSSFEEWCCVSGTGPPPNRIGGGMVPINQWSEPRPPSGR